MRFAKMLFECGVRLYWSDYLLQNQNDLHKYLSLFSMLLVSLLLPLFIVGWSTGAHTNRTLPLVITTWGNEGFVKATQAAVDNLSKGRMVALVEGLSTCEALQCDTTVGYGGSPNEKGGVALDALVFDGPGHKVGAVASMENIKDAAKVAWAVMNFTKHTMLVGEGATAFAESMGFPRVALNTTETDRAHQDWVSVKCQPNYWQNVTPDPVGSCGPYTRAAVKEYTKTSGRRILRSSGAEIISEFNHDTIGMVIIDKEGKISAGTSTNGKKWKIVGRVGDSPIPGAGAYVVDGVGGAAATGDGDILMRYLPSLQAVEIMRQGTKPFKATRKVMQRIMLEYPKFQGAIVAVSKDGSYGAACANLEKFPFTIGVNGTTKIEKIKCFSQLDLASTKEVLPKKENF